MTRPDRGPRPRRLRADARVGVRGEAQQERLHVTALLIVEGEDTQEIEQRVPLAVVEIPEAAVVAG